MLEMEALSFFLAVFIHDWDGTRDAAFFLFHGVQGIWVWPLSYTFCYIPPSVFADSRMV
jgi:hypothetical protein